MIHDLFTVLVLITIVLAIVYLRNAKLRGTSPDRLTSAPRELELEHEVAELRNRIAVLERIATDERKGRSIAAEIEALRD